MQAFGGAYNGISYQVTPASILPEEIGYRSTVVSLGNPHMFSYVVQLAIQVLVSSQPPLSSSVVISTTTPTTQPPLFERMAFSDISNTSSTSSPMDEIDVPHPFSLNVIVPNGQASPPSAFEESVQSILKFQTSIPDIPLKVQKEMPKKPSLSKSKTTTAMQAKGTIRKKKREITEKELAEREARRELRIAKNRQAAARSNLRRKQQNDSLKAALAAARNRALQLRDRHLKLREENLSLKMALFAPDVVRPSTSGTGKESWLASHGIRRRRVKC